MEIEIEKIKKWANKFKKPTRYSKEDIDECYKCDKCNTIKEHLEETLKITQKYVDRMSKKYYNPALHKSK